MASRVELSSAVLDRTDIVAQWNKTTSALAPGRVGIRVPVPRDQVVRYLWLAGGAGVGGRDWFVNAAVRFYDDNLLTCEIPILNWEYLASIPVSAGTVGVAPSAMVSDSGIAYGPYVAAAGPQPPLVLRCGDNVNARPLVVPCLQLKVRAQAVEFVVNEMVMGGTYDVNWPVFLGFAVMSTYP
ncbi:MAG: hypothetical protein ABMA26_15080 [Limisphaerales bacterium]